MASIVDVTMAQARGFVAAKDEKSLVKLGKEIAERTLKSQYGSTYAFLLEYLRESYRFLKVGEEYYKIDELCSPLLIGEGTYTIAYPDSEETFTFRVRTVKTGKLAGKTVIDYLKGTDPSALDFETFAFVNEYTINVFFKFERLGGASGWLVNKAREIEKLVREGKGALDAAGFAYAQRSNRCRFCNKVLTDEASKAAGCGITCAANYGIPHAGLVEKGSRKAPRTEEETMQDVTAKRPYYGYSDKELDEMIDSAEREDARAQDAFENPTGNAAARKAANAMISELEYRATIENVTELVFCGECGRVLVPRGELCSKCEDERRYEAGAADRYGAKYGI